MHNAGFVVNSYMGLVPEVPCVALFSRMRLRVTLLVLIFGRRWCFYESRVDNRALLENQVAFRQQSYNLGEQALLQIILNQQIPESPQRIPV